MQILTIINQNFEKLSRNPSNRTKVNISNIEILAKIVGKESKLFRKLTNAI